ncbi:hypothetical protein [Spirosoma aerolatum]|uniref:hypothetical protein n=1 Tax=Spirosoma aerolatum TaxID=1211326 RepID=UPI0009ADC97B|nr:hypothetical protein [Spirosoma aerolatum]
MRVQVWNYQGYDIAAPTSGDPYNYFAVIDSSKVIIKEESLKIGPIEFTPGQDFQKLGNGKKTSAGYYSLEIDNPYALRYIGTANGEYLLFRKVVNGIVFEGNRDLFSQIMHYQDVFFTYRRLSPDDGCLFWLTGAGAGRIIEL